MRLLPLIPALLFAEQSLSWVGVPLEGLYEATESYEHPVAAAGMWG